MSAGSLLILDEAHHGAPSSGSRYSIDSKFTELLRDVAPLFEHRLFLSATPHNGHSSSFSALLELLDPQRFCRGVPVAPRLRDEILVRRLKKDLRKISGGFPERHVQQVDISDLPDDAPELVLAHLLDEYRALREQRLEDAGKKERASSLLVLGHLQKRLLSSIEAFARTLAVSRKSLERRAKQAAAQPPSRRNLSLLIAPPSSDDATAELSEEELEGEIEAQLEEAIAADPNVYYLNLVIHRGERLEPCRRAIEPQAGSPDRGRVDLADATLRILTGIATKLRRCGGAPVRSVLLYCNRDRGLVPG